MTDAPAATRIDIWLWRARFFKTRGLSAKTAARGLRINGRRTDKPGAAVRVGDVLTFVQADRVRVIEIVDLGERRGPASEAQALYRDHDASTPEIAADVGPPDVRHSDAGLDDPERLG